MFVKHIYKNYDSAHLFPFLAPRRPASSTIRTAACNTHRGNTLRFEALGFGVRIGIEEQALREGLQGYEDYARRVRWRLVPFVW